MTREERVRYLGDPRGETCRREDTSKKPPTQGGKGPPRGDIKLPLEGTIPRTCLLLEAQTGTYPPWAPSWDIQSIQSDIACKGMKSEIPCFVFHLRKDSIQARSDFMDSDQAGYFIFGFVLVLVVVVGFICVFLV